MLIDITLKITPEMTADAHGNAQVIFSGHLGTHFDIMDKEFPLEYTERPGIAFDVSGIEGRDIDVSDIDMDMVAENMFVAFHTGYIERENYGTKKYFSEHPQLSDALIDELLKRNVSIIRIDCSGIRRGSEHIPKDRLCAEHGTFVVENLCNLKALTAHSGKFIACTYPMNYANMTGLPCRVIAKT